MGLGAVQFGQSKAAVISALTNAFGAPPTLGQNSLCYGTGYTAATWSDLTITFDPAGDFLQYQYFEPQSGTPTPSLRTKAGVTLGTSVADLESAYPSGNYSNVASEATIEDGAGTVQFFTDGERVTEVKSIAPGKAGCGAAM